MVFGDYSETFDRDRTKKAIRWGAKVVGSAETACANGFWRRRRGGGDIIGLASFHINPTRQRVEFVQAHRWCVLMSIYAPRRTINKPDQGDAVG